MKRTYSAAQRPTAESPERRFAFTASRTDAGGTLTARSRASEVQRGRTTKAAPAINAVGLASTFEVTAVRRGFREEHLGRAAGVSLCGTFTGVRSVDVSRATVVLRSVLFDPHGPGKLLRHSAPPGTARAAAAAPLPSRLGPTTLRHANGGTFSGPRSAVRGQLPPTPRGLRVLRRGHGAITKRGLTVRRLTKLRSGKAQTIRVALVPNTSGRRCTTVRADAILRKQATGSACIEVAAARRRVSGLG